MEIPGYVRLGVPQYRGLSFASRTEVMNSHGDTQTKRGLDGNGNYHAKYNHTVCDCELCVSAGGTFGGKKKLPASEARGENAGGQQHTLEPSGPLP